VVVGDGGDGSVRQRVRVRQRGRTGDLNVRIRRMVRQGICRQDVCRQGVCLQDVCQLLRIYGRFLGIIKFQVVTLSKRSRDGGALVTMQGQGHAVRAW